MTQKKNSKEIIQTVKGMRDILGDDYYRFQGFFEKAQEVAMYYGFNPIELPIIEQEELYTSSIGAGTDILDKEMYGFKAPKSTDKLALRPEGTAGAMRAYLEHGMISLPQPVMLYYYGPMFRHDKPQRGRYREFRQFGLEIMGSNKSILDALIIKLNVAILEEVGAKNLIVQINSVGNKDCRPQYIKELTNYYRKNINKLGKLDRERLKTNPLRILDSKDPETLVVNEAAPDFVSYLTPECKKHFKEVLEYLEEMGITYQINKSLVRGLDYYTDTVFEIQTTITEEDGIEKELTIAAGGRYDYLAKDLGSKKEIPAIGSAIGVDRVLVAPWYKDVAPRNLKKPKVYFIQLGTDAKMKSLHIIELLRQAKIPVLQSLSKDSLGSQLGVAEKLEIPHTLIFGQKEALEGSVIVRDMKNRSQETVKIEKLIDHLKKMK